MIDERFTWVARRKRLTQHLLATHHDLRAVLPDRVRWRQETASSAVLIVIVCVANDPALVAASKRRTRLSALMSGSVGQWAAIERLSSGDRQSWREWDVDRVEVPGSGDRA